MAFLSLDRVAVKGIAACVPKCVRENAEEPVFGAPEDALKFMASTGIQRRRISDQKTASSDLCFHAAERLIAELDWEKSEIDCLIFVSQTPDYILPATSCILQDRLGLREECYTLDISLGCSGWVYALSVVASLLSSGCMKKGLLLAGDTVSKLCSNEDKSTYPLFGDAGTATALEYGPDNGKMDFHFCSDGSGYQTIIVPQGGGRNKATVHSFEKQKIEEGIVRTGMDIDLNGMDVFAFGISKAPRSVEALLDKTGTDRTSIDAYIFYQANLFMNEKIRKKLKLTQEQVPYSLRDFGNTSCASIPLTMVTELSDKLSRQAASILCCGFGVGLSWGSVQLTTDKIRVPELIEI